ncbi:acyclic terpene utilization AtuA family protein [Streptomyces sp. SID13031]|uniref:acyclic terpene utilization AtuA family protein n=1 Tax=Streptomyces sp. SID13031 TaxID=2706046 RepID=UPI0023B344F2|nr:acyclic terpene utilization AtuA family protein [Streptomyces sp. SID13031]
MADWPLAPVAANAYLGGWGIAAALADGVDIVICGRVTDASLVLGPAAWWHGWRPDDWDALAGAVLAGHIIECGPQTVGGNFAGFQEMTDLRHPGFPTAEIAADGTSVICKNAAHGGAVTVDTVTAQILYEIQGPRYLNPDVTLRLDAVSLEQIAEDRVRVSGATRSPPTATAKVAIFAQSGYTVVGSTFVTAPDVAEKVDLLRAQLEFDLPSAVTELDITQLGVLQSSRNRSGKSRSRYESLLRPTPRQLSLTSTSLEDSRAFTSKASPATSWTTPHPPRPCLGQESPTGLRFCR